MKKAVKKAVPKVAKKYEELLLREINEDREEHGKKPFDDSKSPKESEVKESTTDPYSGVFHKGEHKKCFEYTAQTACDKNGYVAGITVNPENMHDSTAFDELYEIIIKRCTEIMNVVMDSACKIPWICKRLIDDGRIPVLPYKRPMGAEGFFRPYEYVYDEYYDCVICPENKVLNYSTTNRDGYKEFKGKSYQCENCLSRNRRTNNAKCVKTVTEHIWGDYPEISEDIRHAPKYRELYEKRKETIERVFADAEEKHSMRYTFIRGLAQVTNWVRLKFAVMNLKKFAIHRQDGGSTSCFIACFFVRFCFLL